MKKYKLIKVLALALAMLMMVMAFAGCGNKNENQGNSGDEKTRTIVDMNGQSIEVPEKVTKYITLWPSHQSVLAMLDNCESMAACLYDPKNEFSAWLYEMYPDVPYDASIGEEMSAEEVIELGVDVVFWQNTASETLAKQLNDAGIAAVNIAFTDYESMKKSISITADVLNTDYAREMASKFNAELDSTVKEISDITSTIKDEDKLRVLNLRNFETLRADGKNTVADTWLGICGAVNVVSEQNLEGNQYLTKEQIFEWNPDVIMSSATGDAAWAYEQSDLSTLAAVKNKTVYDNPAGIFYWNRYSTETILQLKWASKLFYPELFAEVNIEQEIKDYYKTFYGYEISDENIQQMLKVLTPVGWDE